MTACCAQSWSSSSSTAVIETLALRMERSFAAARQVVDRLDRLALERGRRVTRLLVQEVLAELFPQEAG